MSILTKILAWVLVIAAGAGLVFVATSDFYEFPEVFFGITG